MLWLPVESGQSADQQLNAVFRRFRQCLVQEEGVTNRFVQNPVEDVREGFALSGVNQSVAGNAAGTNVRLSCETSGSSLVRNSYDTGFQRPARPRQGVCRFGRR